MLSFNSVFISAGFVKLLPFGNAPPESIAKKAKDERADRAHRERQRDGVTKLCDARAEIACHCRDHKCEQKKIEGIQRPAEEASDECIALIPVE